MVERDHCMDEPGIDENQLKVEASAKHEHVAVETHLGDAARVARQRVANGDDADVVVAVL